MLSFEDWKVNRSYVISDKIREDFATLHGIDADIEVLSIMKSEYEQYVKQYKENKMSMLNTGADVATFLEAVGQTVNENVIESWRKNEQAQLYMKLVVEEFEETAQAWNEGDSVELADGCADLIWVLQGLMLSVGIPMQEVWDEVARSNLAKIDPETGVVIKREDGKILKPAGWTAPDIKTIIDASSYAEASQTFKG